MNMGSFDMLPSDIRISYSKSMVCINGYVGFILFNAIFISSICKFAYSDLFDK